MKVQLQNYQKSDQLDQDASVKIKQLLDLLHGPEFLTNEQARRLIAIMSKQLKALNFEKDFDTIDQGLTILEEGEENFEELIRNMLDVDWRGQPITEKQYSQLLSQLRKFEERKIY